MQTIVYSGIFAGMMAIFVTVAIEKWGGVKGGILGTLPTTIVPAAVGIYAVDPFSFSKAMLVVPFGMLLNGATLCIWVILPPYLPKTGKLWITLTSSLLFWLAAGILVIQFEPNYSSAFIEKKQGNAWVVAVKDGNMQKTVIARPEHLRPLE